MADPIAVEDVTLEAEDTETLPPTNHQQQRKSLTPLPDKNGDTSISTFATERQASPPPPLTIPPTATRSTETQKSPKKVCINAGSY